MDVAPSHQARGDAEPAVVVDCGDDLELGPVVQLHAAHHIHLPQLHGTVALEAATVAAIMATDDRFDTLMKITEHDMPCVALDSITAPELDITSFAPTDDAFAVLPPGVLDWLRNDDNVSDLQLVYDHHVLRASHSLGVLWSMIQAGDAEIQALDESPIRLSLVDGVLRVDEATVIEGDIEAVNGVIHVIDALMIPDSVSIP